MKFKLLWQILPISILITTSASAFAQSVWPTKPIRIVVASTSGGALDTLTRIYADALSKALKTPVIVDAKPGAGGIIAADAVAKSAADGYTFLSGANGIITNGMLRDKMPYADSDLIPVAQFGADPAILIADPKLNINSLRDLQTYALAHPGEVTYGTAGSGTSSHFFAVMLQNALGVPIRQIPYKGPSDAAVAVAGGLVSLASGTGLGVLPLITSKKVVAIASAGQKRWGALPEVPTTAQAGFPSVQVIQWGGLFAPKGTPAAILDRINREVVAAPDTKEVGAQLGNAGTDLSTSRVSRAEFEQSLKAQRAMLGKLIKDNNLKAE